MKRGMDSASGSFAIGRLTQQDRYAEIVGPQRELKACLALNLDDNLAWFRAYAKFQAPPTLVIEFSELPAQSSSTLNPVIFFSP